MRQLRNKLLRLSSMGIIALMASQAYATGFRMEFQSASVLADSGDAAVVEDAGTNWYNSAGLVDLPQQVVLGGFDVYVRTKIQANTVAPSSVFPTSLEDAFIATGRSTSKPNALIPLFHYSYPINPNWALGISVNPAWGFSEDYGRDSLVRYNTTRVYSKTLMISPSLSMRLNDCWSLGVGPDFHYFSVQSRANARTQPLTVGDSSNRFSADNWDYGAHAGILYRMNENTRFGLNYRTQIATALDGHSTFILNGITGFENRHFRLSFRMPAVTTLSAYHDINPCIAVMGTISYDQWGVLNHYHVRNVATPLGPVENIYDQQHMRNTVDFGLGMHYHYNDQWMFRANVKYVPTPTRAAYRAPLFPDGDKLGFQIGARYHVSPCLAIDALYGHVFVKQAHINAVDPLSGAVTTGHVNTSIDLVGGQIVWNV